MRLNCQKCGACCVSPNGIFYGKPKVHIDITEEDAKRMSRYFRRRYVVRGTEVGVPAPIGNLLYLTTKETLDGYACAAFRGRVNGLCRCVIYDRRPDVCRYFTKGRNNMMCTSCREDFDLKV